MTHLFKQLSVVRSAPLHLDLDRLRTSRGIRRLLNQCFSATDLMRTPSIPFSAPTTLLLGEKPTDLGSFQINHNEGPFCPLSPTLPLHSYPWGFRNDSKVRLQY